MPSFKRFDGVVGYHICLTHRRSPVQTRVEPAFFFPARIGTILYYFCVLPNDLHRACGAWYSTSGNFLGKLGIDSQKPAALAAICSLADTPPSVRVYIRMVLLALCPEVW